MASRVLVAASIALSTIATTGAHAVPSSATPWAIPQRVTAGSFALTGGGFLFIQYTTYLQAGVNLAEVPPNPYIPDERNFIIVSGCMPGGCLFAEAAPVTPAHPHDPLLQGGVRLFQAFVTGGNCEGTLLTVALNTAPAGPIRNQGEHGETVDPEGVDVLVGSGQTRQMRVTGSVTSCLGTAAVDPEQTAAFAGNLIYFGVYTM